MLQIFFNFKNIPEHTHSQIKTKLNKKLEKIQALTQTINYPIKITAKFTSINTSQYEVSYSVKLPTDSINVSKTGSTLTKAIEQSFNILKSQTLKYLEQQKEHQKISIQYQSEIPIIEVERTVKDQNKEQFSALIIKYSPKIRNYIERQIEYVTRSKQLNDQILSADDVYSEVIEHAYKQYNRRPSHLTIYWWMYTIADKIISDRVFVNIANEHRNQSYESLMSKEIKDLDFNFILNADGDLQTKDTTPFQESKHYKINEILKVPDRLQQLEDSELLRKVLSIISYLPEFDRTVFDLYIMDGFTEDEIAGIKKVKKQLIHDTINKVIKLVQGKLN